MLIGVVEARTSRVSWIQVVVGAIGARFIYALIWIFGRTHDRASVAWVEGPVGERVIGDAAFQQTADREALTIERTAREGGLIPDFEVLRCDDFDPSQVHPAIRDFYEHTAAFEMDVWSHTYFPAKIALWLLVTTISRQVNQLNFPLSPLETAHGIASEIILLRRRDGSVRYTGWFRTLVVQERAIYTGFYMTERMPGEAGPCVKVVFPMPNGNATVILRAAVEHGALILDSSGGRFGGAGFYRVQQRGPTQLRIWRVATLRERFRVYVDHADVLRCDHSIRFLGLPVLTLHYKLRRR
jgi:hypothetical protein